jgi:hypothetical protein
MINHTHTQYTSIFTWKPNAGENHRMFFLYVFKNYIHWKHQLSLFSSSNQKEATTPYVLQIQPEGGYNHLSLPHPTTLKYKCQM